MIRFAEVSMGTGPAVGCARCGSGRVETTVYRATDEISAEIARVCAAWEGRPGPNLRLTGAEPFGHPELPRVVSAAAAAGCRRLGVDSDCIALRSPQNAGGAVMAGVRHLRFELLGGTAGLHDTLSGAPGLLDATLEGVRSFRAAAAAEAISTSVTAVVTACRHNVHDLPAAVGLAVDAGVDSVLIRLADGGIDIGAAVAWIVAACDTGVVNGVWVEVEGVPFCLLPGYGLHVSDMVRARAGAKPAGCRECALDAVCAGAGVGASADQLAELTPPPFAPALAAAVRRARGEAV